ncbi:MAG: hypothetical protein AAF587_27020 [Bacteroidota bacterium]
MHKHLLFILLLLLISCQSKEQPPSPFPWHSPSLLKQEGTVLMQYWEGPDSPSLWTKQVEEFSALQAFRDSLTAAIGLHRLQAIVKRDSMQLTPWPEENFNHEQTHNGRVGKIRDINYLEAQLLNYQLSRYPLFSHPTELSSMVLRHDSLQQLRIYFAASDTPWPPKAPEVMDHMEQALEEGWRLHAHLHNHFEPDSNLYLGIMAPSMSDVQVLRWMRDEYGLQEVWITNGFTTVEIQAPELDQLNSH